MQAMSFSVQVLFADDSAVRTAVCKTGLIECYSQVLEMPPDFQ